MAKVRKEDLIQTIEALPEDALEEVMHFVEHLLSQHRPPSTPYKPVALGGIWKGIEIDDEDIEEVRKEMWQTFSERIR